MTRLTFLATLLVAIGSTAIAADAVKVNLKDFKWKSAFDGGADLGGYDENDDRFFLYTNGTASGEVAIPEDGEYTITVEASCSAAEKELAQFKLEVGETVVVKEHKCTTEDKKKYAFTAKLKKGKQTLSIAFLNDKFKEGEYDMNLFVYSIAIEKK